MTAGEGKKEAVWVLGGVMRAPRVGRCAGVYSAYWGQKPSDWYMPLTAFFEVVSPPVMHFVLLWWALTAEVRVLSLRCGASVALGLTALSEVAASLGMHLAVE